MTEQSVLLMRAVRGPIILITVGVLFALDKFTEFRFVQTWPVLLIIIGLLSLVGGGRMRKRDRFASGLNSGQMNQDPPSADAGARR